MTNLLNGKRWTLTQFQWRCRRGTKELDIMLQRFFKIGFDSLNEDQLDTLQRLLTDVEDPDLQPWLMGDKPALEEYKQLVELIRGAQLTI